MNPYVNEDVAWQRLLDLQREMENSRLLATQGIPWAVRLVGLLGRRAWWLAGIAAHRAPRRSRGVLVAREREEGGASTDAA